MLWGWDAWPDWVAPLIVPLLVTFGGTLLLFTPFALAFLTAATTVFFLPERRGQSLPTAIRCNPQTPCPPAAFGEGTALLWAIMVEDLEYVCRGSPQCFLILCTHRLLDRVHALASERSAEATARRGNARGSSYSPASSRCIAATGLP